MENRKSNEAKVAAEKKTKFTPGRCKHCDGPLVRIDRFLLCLEMCGRLQPIPVAESVTKYSHIYKISGDGELYTFDKQDRESGFRIPKDATERVARVGGKRDFAVRMFTQVKLSDADRKRYGFKPNKNEGKDSQKWR